MYVVGDIDRGGVLAHFFGTYHIVDAVDRALIRGFVVNKFRGDSRSVDPGLVELEDRTGVPTVAVLPYIHGLWVDAEDSLQAQVGATNWAATPGIRHAAASHYRGAAAPNL